MSQSWTDQAQANYISRKRKLALAKASGDPDQIIRTCTEAAQSFARLGWPDSWSDWRRAYDDALFAKQRKGERVQALIEAGDRLFNA